MAQESLSAHIQDSLAFLCITSSPFLKLVRNYVRPELVPSDPVYRTLNACYRYFDLTKDAPGDHICDVLDDELKGMTDSKKQLVYHFIDRVSQMKPPNADYIISKISAFVKTREFELGAVEFVKLVGRGEFQKAELLMHNVLRAGVEKENVGLDYLTDFSFMQAEEVEPALVKLGIKHFDVLRSFHREELLCVLGGYKGKKSWAGHHIGQAGLLNGLNVLHVSHENKLSEVEARYDRGIGALANLNYRNGELVPVRYIDEHTGRLLTSMEKRPCISDPDARKHARLLMRKYGGRLIIKKFPMYSCTMGDLERYLDYLERFEDFTPDILINDYPDIMKPDDSSMATRDQLNQSYMHHKRLADDRKMLVTVFSQATREAIRAKRLTMKDFAEDIRKLANVDTAMGVCQTEVQADSELATLYVVAARSGKMDCGCGIVMNLDIGQFASDSFELKESVKVAPEESSDTNNTK